MRDNVLIVEHETNLRGKYKSELQREGYRVMTVANGHEAMSTLNQNKIDLIILALGLPDGSGLDYLQKFVELHRSVRVVINTDYPLGKMDFHSWTADAYVLKSDDMTELKKTIDKLLHTSRKAIPS